MGLNEDMTLWWVKVECKAAVWSVDFETDLSPDNECLTDLVNESSTISLMLRSSNDSHRPQSFGSTPPADCRPDLRIIHADRYAAGSSRQKRKSLPIRRSSRALFFGVLIGDGPARRSKCKLQSYHS